MSKHKFFLCGFYSFPIYSPNHAIILIHAVAKARTEEKKNNGIYQYNFWFLWILLFYFPRAKCLDKTGEFGQSWYSLSSWFSIVIYSIYSAVCVADFFFIFCFTSFLFLFYFPWAKQIVYIFYQQNFSCLLFVLFYCMRCCCFLLLLHLLLLLLLWGFYRFGCRWWFRLMLVVCCVQYFD